MWGEVGTYLMRHFFDEWNKGDMDALNDVIEETVDPDFVNHSAANLEDAGGPEGVKNMFCSFRVAFPDGRTTIEDIVAEGDTVVTRWTFRGTHQAKFAGLAPTGQRVEMTGINIDRIANGRFVERWYEMDRLSLIRQLGAAPEQNLEETARRNRMLDDYCSELGRDPAQITRSLLVFPRASDAPFDSDDAFHDYVGRYREIGIDEFILYWWREDAIEYGYERSLVERCADREMIERLATETIPALRADP
jgi:steroid delta-isomerase-like uncharacterized protein